MTTKSQSTKSKEEKQKEQEELAKKQEKKNKFFWKAYEIFVTVLALVLVGVISAVKAGSRNRS